MSELQLTGLGPITIELGGKEVFRAAIPLEQNREAATLRADRHVQGKTAGTP